MSRCERCDRFSSSSSSSLYVTKNRGALSSVTDLASLAKGILLLSNHSRGLQLNLHKPRRNFFKSDRRALAHASFPSLARQKVRHIAFLMKPRDDTGLSVDPKTLSNRVTCLRSSRKREFSTILGINYDDRTHVRRTFRTPSVQMYRL